MIQNSLLSELACALTDHEVIQSGAAHFVDLSTGDLAFILPEHMIEEGEITEDEICSYKEWEQDAIRTYIYHDLVRIEPIPSYESFRIMEAFTELCSESEQQQRLFKVLQGSRPFAGFRNAVEDMGMLRQWYDFKNQSDANMAVEWLNENGLEINDGKIMKK